MKLTGNETLEELRQLEDETARQLAHAKREAEAWSSGKYKGGSNAQMSRSLVSSYERQLASIIEKIRHLESEQ
ncbi:hypothetical protein SAMN05216369_2250 [Marinobacter antarcticus]|uniref:Uncharacterized protein n=1 Tax=Marinobacter antarcticus TaxID=564117 RepID=A0A1M6SU37_9GAMM|nr:hypothetical protein [Marinobacter antarcticus]SHK48176.1 hypothetical protein SAMN05216369_2250 [Marinobacter antarcticus]